MCAIAEMHDLHILSKVMSTSGVAYVIRFTAMASNSLGNRSAANYKGEQVPTKTIFFWQGTPTCD
jgi:hypothetical protein